MRWWLGRAPRWDAGEMLEDNLAVGWFDSAAPEAPLREGHCLMTRTNVGETGLVVATVGGEEVLAVPAVLNIPTHCTVVLRERGAVYCGASIEGVGGLDAWPLMRPLAIDLAAEEGAAFVHPGVHQSVLGQVGFSADTRIYGVTVETIPEWSSWWGTASAADSLRGSASLVSSTPEQGSAS